MYKEPIIHVGILSGEQIAFELTGHYQMTGTYCQGVVTVSRAITGAQCVSLVKGSIGFDGTTYETLRFDPLEEECSFLLKGVTIGIQFHWERREDQRFLGSLRFIREQEGETEKLTAVNMLPVEEYLTSVISSEMSATASPELLKAHAVISRSWLMSILASRLQKDPEAPSIFWRTAARRGDEHRQTEEPVTGTEAEEEIKWYDNTMHTRYDVCADDHCQRYQGITRASTPQVREAIATTCGQVLTYGNALCDTRFSKCCGGVTEEYQYCWENIRKPYLASVQDPFCNTRDRHILSQVLNDYDQETADFYRWQVEYTQEELAELIRQRSGRDYGEIIDLQPVARGASGRIWKLRIVGTKQTRVIGKELEIRRTLSPSHLYSSAFTVEKEGGTLPSRFILRGAGWGHGVGLCQIGAAVMGAKGYRYNEILRHYYTGAEIQTIYT